MPKIRDLMNAVLQGNEDVLLGRDPTIERYRQAAARAPKGSGRKAE
jgi:hypothetical protein